MEFALEYISYLFILITVVYFTSHVLGVSLTQHRYQELDGLRGLCAASVCIFHLYWRAGGAADKYWSLDYINSSAIKHAIYLTGQLPVGLFFMLSGFLFFKKALNNTFNLKTFTMSRLLRIYPPIIATLILIYFLTIPLSTSYHQANWTWFLHSLPFIFNPPGAVINGTSLQIATSGVFWTLVWELRLYLAIPFLYLIMRKIRHKTTFIIAAIAFVKIYSEFISKAQEVSYALYFLCGFLIATINFNKTPSNMACTVLLVLAIYFTKHAYNSTTPLYMVVIFYTIKNGCDFYGILNSQPIRYLGTCSFSLYLLHGISQTVSKHFLFNQGEYMWQICSLIAAGILAPMMYKTVESRSINWAYKLKTVRA